MKPGCPVRNRLGRRVSQRACVKPAARFIKGGLVKYLIVILGLLLAYTLFYAGLSKMSTGLTMQETG